jgi:hypothetical protein
VLACIVMLAAMNGGAQDAPGAARASDGDLEIVQIRPAFYMIVGAGANIAVRCQRWRGVRRYGLVCRRRVRGRGERAEANECADR